MQLSKQLKRSASLAAILSMLSGIAVQAAETQKYRYDSKGRLVKVERSGTINNGVTTEYTHDKAHNRIRLKTIGSPNSPPPP